MEIDFGAGKQKKKKKIKKDENKPMNVLYVDNYCKYLL